MEPERRPVGHERRKQSKTTKKKLKPKKPKEIPKKPTEIPKKSDAQLVFEEYITKRCKPVQFALDSQARWTGRTRNNMFTLRKDI